MTLKRRRIENKTDYAKRLKLLKSEKPRIVFRKTNKYVIGQYVTSHETQDKIEIGVNSGQLLKYGWPEEFKGSLKSIPASYLTGLLIGKKIIKDKKEMPIVDFGMIRNMHKTKTFAFLKGIVDAGIEVSHDESIFPEEDRIMGKNLKEDFSKTFEKIKSKIEKE
jgi:large subunit ribosomal protein L18